jgi:hypothetical protein
MKKAHKGMEWHSNSSYAAQRINFTVLYFLRNATFALPIHVDNSPTLSGCPSIIVRVRALRSKLA